jgi:hypothetical protein
VSEERGHGEGAGVHAILREDGEGAGAHCTLLKDIRRAEMSIAQKYQHAYSALGTFAAGARHL